ncbi:hypothetical protein [Companilactobacillus farciminis]|uniref:hypothetical protein n=1 Tax=Companilactobacillus farciminis TaxID=1612 RepID=UPI00191551C3|nr:hypothetical protein [Companilactobacillus farciminis]
MNDDNLAVYQMRENRYKNKEITAAMHKELFYIEDINMDKAKVMSKVWDIYELIYDVARDIEHVIDAVELVKAIDLAMSTDEIRSFSDQLLEILRTAIDDANEEDGYEDGTAYITGLVIYKSIEQDLENE